MDLLIMDLTPKCGITELVEVRVCVCWEGEREKDLSIPLTGWFFRNMEGHYQEWIKMKSYCLGGAVISDGEEEEGDSYFSLKLFSTLTF